MSQPEVTLSVYDEQGDERKVAVHSKRFSIGRLPENDLAIPDSNLSRRHALIENFDGLIFVSDCGSQNGTTVNGVPVSAPIQLHDGDLITLGGAKDLVVHMAGPTPGPGGNKAVRSAALSGTAIEQYPPGSGPRASAGASSVTKPSGSASWLSTPVIAATAIGFILLLAVGLLLLSQRPATQPKTRIVRQDAARSASPLSETENREVPVSDQGNREYSIGDNQTSGNINSASGTNSNVSTTGLDELDEVEKYALRVMSSISTDTSPTMSRKALGEINERIKSYKGSTSLAEQLRTMKQRGIQQIAGPAKSSDIKVPLVVYASLAKMDRDSERGDPVPVALRMMPVLARLRVTFGTELANDSLLIIAAYDQGPGGVTHPLQATIFELAKRQPESPATIRTVWYLRDHQKLSAEAYSLVVRFIAIGVIAQAPRKFGVDADPLGL